MADTLDKKESKFQKIFKTVDTKVMRILCTVMITGSGLVRLIMGETTKLIAGKRRGFAYFIDNDTINRIR